MPTDDDYGRRERLLLHQHPITQYGSSSSPVPGPNGGTSGSVGSQIESTNSTECYKPSQRQANQQTGDLRGTSGSNVAASQQDRYKSEQSAQGGSEHVDYGGRERMCGIERHDKSTDKPTLDDFPKSCAETRSIQSGCDRYGGVHYQNQERFGQSAVLQTHHQYGAGRASASGQTLSQNVVLAERFPRFNELAGLHGEQRLSLAPSERFQPGNGPELRFHRPASELVSTGNEYANTNILVSGCATSPFSSETFPSPPSPAPANDRFVPPPPLSPSPSEKYSSTQSLAGYPAGDRILPPGSPSARYGGGTAPASPMPAKERFSSAERLLANQQPSAGSVHESKDQQRYAGASDRLLSGSSPVLGSLQAGLQSDRNGLYSAGKDSAAGSRYGAMSTDRLLSSSPIHAPVPERFASKSTERYLGGSPVHERYHRQETASVHHERYSTLSSSAERFLSNSPNPEASSHQRYSSTERSLQASSSGEQRRLYTDRGVETVCQKYGDRPAGSPAPTDFNRYSSFQEVGNTQSRYVGTADRFNELAIQRCGQSRGNDRFCVSTDRYLASSSPGHDGRMANGDASRYVVSGSSTERLLSATSSSSSSSTDTVARYHSSYTNTTATQSATSSDRFTSVSPTPEASSTNLRSGTTGTNVACPGYQTATKTSVDKYLQVSKSVQSYANDRYNPGSDQFDRLGQDRSYDRFSGNGADRFSSATTTPDRFHSATDRYSPVRAADKYLSLPKPKDRYTGRITPISSSCGTSVAVTSTDRTYGSASATGSYVPPTAHTPVERYVPQPPPEVLYPDRYVDRYVPPSAHTPTDRYVPTNDPADPYMRRDLGFHHHYRLPPPAGYPYHQSHFRLRGFAYASPGRLGGSPGSSSSSSSASNQRDSFSMSPSLRPKVRVSAVEFPTTGSGVRHVCTNPPSCCNEASGSGRSCCQAIRRSLPPGALPSIPTQSAWQPSPGSGTTGTSTVSSTAPDGENGQSIGLYPVGSVGPTPTDSTAATPITTTATIPMTTAGTVAATAAAGPSIARSASAPTAPRPVVQLASTSSNPGPQKPRLRRTMSRTEAIRNYIRRETAQFFGVDEESETVERQRWLDRRRRMASRKYGALVPEHRPPDPDITRDVPDTTDVPEGVTLRRWQQPVRRKDSVARMTLSGLHYVVESLTRQRPRERSQTRPESRSFPPSVVAYMSRAETAAAASPETGQDEEESFFERPPPPPPPPPPPASQQQSQSQIDSGIGGSSKDEDDVAKVADLHDSPADRETSDELVRFALQKDERTMTDGQVRRPRHIPRDHYISRDYRKTSWSRSRYDRPLADSTRLQQDEGVTLRRDLTGATRISPSTIDRIFDNSNRRQYGMGIVGRYLGRSFRKSVSQKPDVRKQLDDFEDHRPYFTYWITTVQVLILIISLACYGFGPVGMDLSHRSGLVLVTSLSLQQVDYQEPANFWFGPRAADLIHLGAKFAPCMRRDIKILKEIDVWRERERDTACCIRNDDSGCVQSSKADCSIRGLRSTATNTISTWKKWGPGDSGPGGRISGSVCGLDPKFCDAPASIAPYEWPDDITKWPICRKTNPFNQRFRNGSQRANGNFPVSRYKDKMAEHMVCEVIGHPCCIGIHGMCRITTKEYCDFVHGYFHEEASLCSQVECLHDVCGMIPFLHPEWPDQFYRLFTTMFLHAGILHLSITLLIQYFLMRDLEKLTGSLRIALIYFTGALAGNLASAIFVPYRAEVGPAGAHFALLATLIVEVLHCWPMLKHPRRTLSKLILVLVGLLILGILPWVDNYAHLFGFIFGFLAAYALMPFISFGHYDRRRKIWLIWICLILIVVLFTLLLALFYNVPVYECEVCKLFNCIPFTRDFCASQNINFKREEPV
ncbi:inactive rhomboid protein 1 isoform X2 [Ceratina calcarata]|uniref:Inactive rhomboid protein 1 isoform X2 n=1 Tax=Ceratina calcarata TaxID=156304 RepID=A0AAJ7S6M7_9HYME|nr:inactive rhomboid protein 1 isoform X2 [Ceratina calcarata]